MVESTLNTIKSFEDCLALFGIHSANVSYHASTNRIKIIIYKQKFRAWWNRKKILKFIKYRKCVGVQVEIYLNIFDYDFSIIAC